MLKLLFRKEMGVILLFLLLCITGLVLVSFMGIQLYPRTNRPAVTSTITHQGYSALAFSQEYAEMIESQLMAIPGQDRVEVRYGNNQSTFTITFDWNVDSQQGMLDAESAFSQIEARLPSDLAEISKVRFSTGENAGFLIIGIGSPTESAENLYNTAQGILEARMTRVEDVETVEILKVEELRAEIELRQHEMLQYGLVIGDIDTALQQGSNARSIGTLKDGNSQLSVQIIASQSDLLDIGQTIVRETASGIVRLDDVADISIEYAVPDVTFVMEGQRGIQIIATPVDGGNIRNMSNDIIDIVYMARETGELPADTQIHLLLDPAAYINRSIGHVIKAAIIGALLAMMVVFMALGKIRNTLLIGISLPVTMVLSFIPLYLMDISLNLISLGGMALAVGMIVDSAIVVIENIHRFRVEENYTPGDRKHLQDLIVRAVRQVRSPVIASTLTSVLVFLPISFTAPLTNAILGEQSIV
ncbi:MAG: efflux RND transporter permease subunit, partial [Spirochaetaceae bacterium]